MHSGLLGKTVHPSKICTLGERKKNHFLNLRQKCHTLPSSRDNVATLTRNVNTYHFQKKFKNNKKQIKP